MPSRRAPDAAWQGRGRSQLRRAVRVGRRTRRVTIKGTLTLTQAKDAARKLLAQVALGRDPQGEKEAARQATARAFRTVVADYLEAKQPELRPNSFRISKLYLAGQYFRALHPMPIAAVTRTDVAAAVRAVTRNHGTATAAAARRALSAFFAWAIADGLLGDAANPVDGSHRPPDPAPRDHVLTTAELAAIWCARAGDEYGRVVKLLMLTGCRRQEIGGLRWSELDLDAGVWRLPKERSKNNRELVVALPSAALAIITSTPRRDGDYVFGDGKGFTSFTRGRELLDRKLASTVRPWRLHDIRRCVATGMADIGIEPHVIEACLNHYSGHRRGVAGIYNRSSYERAAAAAFARWADHVTALVEGRDNKVVPLRAL